MGQIDVHTDEIYFKLTKCLVWLKQSFYFSLASVICDFC